MELLIRRPTVPDLSKLHQFLELGLRHAFAMNGITGAETEITQAIEAKYKDMVRDVESVGQEQFHLLAFHAEQLIGCIGYGPPNSLITSHMEISVEGNWELKSAYVHPEFQGIGVGKTLLAEILKELRDRGRTQIYLDCGYGRSQPFWEKQFGVAIKTLLNYWGPEEHHMIWQVKL